MPDQQAENGRSDDLFGYVEHVQRKLLPKGLESVFNAPSLAGWTQRNIARLARMAKASDPIQTRSLVTEFERQAVEFRPSTPFEVPTTEAIFGPLLRSISKEASRIGAALRRDVLIATSTSIDASPIALPSKGEHILFVGLGTSSFCNYWAKAYAGLVIAISRRDAASKVSSSQDVEEALRKHPDSLFLSCQLALHYASFETVMGFGEVIQPDDHFAYRMQLLQAMELFLLAHEFAHFSAEERFPQWTGQIELEEARKVELFCDSFGLVLSRNCELARDNWLAFTGSGALVILRAMQLSASFREQIQQLSGNESSVHSTHPTFEDRIIALKSCIVGNTAPDQRANVASWIDEYDLIATSLNSLSLQTFEAALKAE